MCLERAEGTAVFPAGQGAWRAEQLRPPGFPSGQILRPVGGRTALPILPGLTSPARKTCDRQTAAESGTALCSALAAGTLCPLVQFYAARSDREPHPPAGQCQAGGSKKRELACAAPVTSAFYPTRYSSVPPDPTGSPTHQRTVPGRRQRKVGTGLRLCPVLPVCCLPRPAPSVLGRKSASCPKNSKRRTGQSLSVFLYPLLSV